MHISLNLDDYLKQFPALTFCDDILKTYFQDREPDVVTDENDGGLFAYKTEYSQNHYRTLVEEQYNTIYNLINLYLPPAEENMAWSDWYYVASNAYKMKGVLASFQYVLDYFNMDPRQEGYLEYTVTRVGAEPNNWNTGNDVYTLAIHVPITSRNADLTKTYLEQLARELLIVNEISTRFHDLEYDIMVTFTSLFYVGRNDVKQTRINFWDCGVKNVVRSVKNTDNSYIYVDTSYKELYTEYKLNVGTVTENRYTFGNIFNPFLTWSNLQRLQINIPNVAVNVIKQIKPNIDMPTMSFTYKARELYKIAQIDQADTRINNQSIREFEFMNVGVAALITNNPQDKTQEV